jgi:hypothetical protein
MSRQDSTSNTQGAPHLGVPNVSRMLELLMTKASDQLTDHEANWLKFGIDDTVSIELDNLHCITQGLGLLIAEDKSAGSFQNKGDLSALLFSIAHQLDTIRGLNSLRLVVEDLEATRGKNQRAKTRKPTHLD